MRTRIVQPGFTIDYMTWIFTRLSAVCMIILAFIGFIGALTLGAMAKIDLVTLLRWSFFPNPNHVAGSIPDLAAGWVNGFWQIMQILILFFVVTHGFNSLRVVMEDFSGPSAWRPLIRGAIVILWLFVLIAALYVIFA